MEALFSLQMQIKPATQMKKQEYLMQLVIKQLSLLPLTHSLTCPDKAGHSGLSQDSVKLCRFYRCKSCSFKEPRSFTRENLLWPFLDLFNQKKYVICNILKQWDNKQISVCFYLSHIRIDMNKEKKIIVITKETSK